MLIIGEIEKAVKLQNHSKMLEFSELEKRIGALEKK